MARKVEGNEIDSSFGPFVKKDTNILPTGLLKLSKPDLFPKDVTHLIS
jgi:hypothetical protein